jgi:hypothetical protein
MCVSVSICVSVRDGVCVSVCVCVTPQPVILIADVVWCVGAGNDPRVIGNIVDGVNRTSDPRHMWLAPYCKGTDHTITITFTTTHHLAMV